MFTAKINEKDVLFHENTVGILGLDADGNVVKRITLAEEQLTGIDNLVLFRAKADQTVDVIATIKNEIETAADVNHTLAMQEIEEI